MNYRNINLSGTHSLIILRKSRANLNGDNELDVLAKHRHALTGLCKDMEMTYDILEEIVSGALAADPGQILGRALEMFQEGKYTSVVCEDIDRLARPDMEESGRILKTLIRCSINVVTPFQIYDPSNPDDIQSLKNKFFFADMELSAYKRRTARATEAIVRKEGRYTTGDAPYGYNWDTPTKTYIPNADYPVIEYLFANVWEKGVTTLQREIREKYGVIMHDGTMTRYFHNPFYAGYPVRRQKMRFGKRVHLPAEEWVWPDKKQDYRHPVTLEQWHDLQALMSSRWKRRDKTAPSDFWAGCVITCSHCGLKLVGAGPYYRCRIPADTTKRCDMAAIRLANVHPKLLSVLRGITEVLAGNNDIYKQMMENVERRKASGRAIKEQLAAAERLAKKLKDQQDNLLNLHLEEVLTLPEYKAKREDILTKQKAAAASIEDLQKLSSVPIVDPAVLQGLRELAGSFDEAWAELSTMEKRAICRFIFAEVTYEKDGAEKMVTVRRLNEPFASILYIEQY